MASGVGFTKPGLEAGQRVGGEGEIAKKADAPQLKASCVHRGESGVASQLFHPLSRKPHVSSA